MIYYADPRAFDDTLLQRLLPLLPKEKQPAIAAIVHPPTKNQAIAAWSLLVFALRLQNLPTPPLAFSETGKPLFADGALQFSLSHTDTLVCLALCGVPVGIDAQKPVLPSDAMLRRVLSESERRALAAADNKAQLFTRFWTQKEAFVKWTGEGLSRRFATLDFAPHTADVFSAYGCRFHVWQFPDAVMTVCSEQPLREARLVTPQMLESALLFQTDS